MRPEGETERGIVKLGGSGSGQETKEEENANYALIPSQLFAIGQSNLNGLWCRLYYSPAEVDCAPILSYHVPAHLRPIASSSLLRTSFEQKPPYPRWYKEMHYAL